MILAAIFAYLSYKKANESGRNGILWAFIALAVFIGVQLITGLFLGIGIGLGIALLGWSENILTSYDILLRIVAVIPGILGGYLVLKYLDRIPEDQTFNGPPPPPTFRG